MDGRFVFEGITNASQSCSGELAYRLVVTTQSGPTGTRVGLYFDGQIISSVEVRLIRRLAVFGSRITMNNPLKQVSTNQYRLHPHCGPLSEQNQHLSIPIPRLTTGRNQLTRPLRSSKTTTAPAWRLATSAVPRGPTSGTLIPRWNISPKRPTTTTSDQPWPVVCRQLCRRAMRTDFPAIKSPGRQTDERARTSR